MVNKNYMGVKFLYLRYRMIEPTGREPYKSSLIVQNHNSLKQVSE